jgi:hypothetical protein
MRDQDDEREKVQLENARMQVSSLRSLIESQKLLRRSTPHWDERMSDYEERFTAAEAELKRLEGLC